MATRLDISTDDLSRYRKLVEGIDLSDSQKDEVIRFICRVMQAFIDQAFGVDPVQLVEKKASTDSFVIHKDYASLPDDAQICPSVYALPAGAHELKP